MDIRKRVKELCRLQGITQKELAGKIGITEISLNATLKAGKDPRISTLEKIAAGLGVPVAALLADGTPTTDNEPVVVHSPFSRCPHCGGKIELYVKAVGEERPE
mgnify:CR=1 FL=1